MISFEIDAFSSGSFVEIEKMFIFGDRFAPLYCPICGAGLIMSEAAGGMCTRCSGNTVPNEAHTECVPCGEGMYTIDCKTCVAKAECTADNYVPLYTPCKNGKRSLHYVKVEPAAVCVGGYVPPADEENLECEPCPEGMHRESGSDECVGCEDGKYYDSKTKSCVQVEGGSISLNTMTFFSSAETSSETELPPGWSTFAYMSSFPNGTVNGWRQGNGFVDCGATIGDGRYTSVLEYKTTDVVADVNIEFEYRVSDESRLRGSALQFFVNDKLYDYVSVRAERDTVFIASSKISVPYTESLTLRFVAQVWTGDLSTVSMKESDIQVRNVVITGLSNGVSKKQECPAGMQNNIDHNRCILCAPGSSNGVSGRMCELCPEGTFASASGEESCKACYHGTTSQSTSGSVRCVTSCVFESTGFSFNMTALADTVIGPVISPVNKRQFYLSVCDGVMMPGECNPQAQDEAQMYICTPGEGSSRLDFGSELEFVDSAGNESDTTVVLRYHARNSDSAVCEGREIVTTVIFRCDPSVGAGFPSVIPGDECAPTITWTSQYACRVCGPNDYETILSKCEGGTQHKEMHLKTGAKCNGAARLIGEELECTDIVVSLGVILGVGGFILILIGMIIFVVWRNRAITVKYTKLLQSQEGDLEAMADEEAERERKEAESQFTGTTATF